MTIISQQCAAAKLTFICATEAERGGGGISQSIPFKRPLKNSDLKGDCRVNKMFESNATPKDKTIHRERDSDSWQHLLSLCWRGQTSSRERKANQEDLEEWVSVFMYTSVSSLNHLPLTVSVCVCLSVSVCCKVHLPASVCIRAWCLCLWCECVSQSASAAVPRCVWELLSLPAVSYQPGRGGRSGGQRLNSSWGQDCRIVS